MTNETSGPAMKFISPSFAFDRAIQEGRLSDNPGSERYAGDYMYMGSRSGRDLFKNIVTRRYVP